MAVIKLPIFGGMIPATDPTLLPDAAADYSENAWLYSGALTGLPEPTLMHDLVNPAASKVFRIPGNSEDPSYLPNSFWMEFENPNTDVVKATIANDSFGRYYWASSNAPPRYNTTARIMAGLPAWLLGLPIPPFPPTVTTPDATSETVTTRVYLYTYVTEYGEESAPSEPVSDTGLPTNAWTVKIPAPPANVRGVDHNVTKWRLYRTVYSNATTFAYFLVAEGDITGAEVTHTDVALDTVISGNSQLESTAWTAPPSDLQGLVTLPNGILAGWRENELWFSEPFRPHAWPAAYTLATEFKIVGLGVTNQTLVVCTEGYPATVSGVNPASMSMSKLTSFEACLSRGSIISAPEGVYYTSPNGLVMVNPGVIENITRQIITRDIWNEITKGSRMRAGRFGTAYYAYGGSLPPVFGDAFQTDFVQQSTTSGAGDGFMVDPFTQSTGVNMLASDQTVAGIMNDAYSGELLMIKEGKVFWFNQGPEVPIGVYKWRSKVFETPKAENFSAIKVNFVLRENDVPPEALPNHSLVQELDAQQLGLVRVFADGRLVATRELRIPGQIFRLPSEYKAHSWQIEFEARVKIKSCQMGTSIKELSVV